MHANCGFGIHRSRNGKQELIVDTGKMQIAEGGRFIGFKITLKGRVFLFCWNKNFFELKGLRVVIGVHHQISTNEILFVCA
jgi:hypothetical protein